MDHPGSLSAQREALEKKVPDGHRDYGEVGLNQCLDGVRIGLGCDIVIRVHPGQALPPKNAALARVVKTPRRRSYLSRCTYVPSLRGLLHIFPKSCL